MRTFTPRDNFIPLFSPTTAVVEALTLFPGFESAEMFRNRCVGSSSTPIEGGVRLQPRLDFPRRAAHFARVETDSDLPHRQSQKPGDDLYKNFKANFPHLVQAGVGTSASVEAATSLAEALDGSLGSRYVSAVSRVGSRSSNGSTATKPTTVLT